MYNGYNGELRKQQRCMSDASTERMMVQLELHELAEAHA